jgi:hypothetical protein
MKNIASRLFSLLQKMRTHIKAVKDKTAQETIWVIGAASQTMWERNIAYSKIALPYLPFDPQVLFSAYLA